MMRGRPDSHLINQPVLALQSDPLLGGVIMKRSALFGSIALLAFLTVTTAQAEPVETTNCDPQQEGEGAEWLAPCMQAAFQGNGHAALMVGAIYWNGDGVAKDHAQAARWFELADLAGETRAAKKLGDEAFGRLVQVSKPEDTDRAVLDTAIGWYEKAVEIEPLPEAKAQAQQSLALLSTLKQQLSAR
jgi:TPR repeat protein